MCVYIHREREGDSRVCVCINISWNLVWYINISWNLVYVLIFLGILCGVLIFLGILCVY